MLTTSRREVTVDNIENESKEKLTFNDSALAREKYDFSGESSFEETSSSPAKITSCSPTIVPPLTALIPISLGSRFCLNWLLSYL